MSLSAYPLHWPEGWPRTNPAQRTTARFHRNKQTLSIADSVRRVFVELERLGAREEDIVISSNIQPTLGGWPSSSGRVPDDPGVAVYWKDKHKRDRVMAIDRYDRVADNLAAIAATLDALRAIERHGGGQILERAFTGFTALPSPDSMSDWRTVLGVPGCRSLLEARQAYLRLRSEHHTDRGGDDAMFHKVNLAIAAAKKEFGQ